ncbi:MAG: M4 family metallopeptidase, partial [Thermoleophilia bacterium]
MTIILIIIALVIPLLAVSAFLAAKRFMPERTGIRKILLALGAALEIAVVLVFMLTAVFPVFGEEKKEPEGFYITPGTGDEAVTDTMLADGQAAVVRLDGETGTPAFLTGDITTPEGDNPQEKALAFFNTNRELYKMEDPNRQLSLTREETDNQGGTHLHMDQTYKDIPVFGSELAVHFSRNGKIVAVNGRFVPETDVSVEAEVSVESAISSAQGDLGFEAPASEEEAPRLVIFAPDRTDPRLTWQIILMSEDPLTRMIYFIDAHSGEVAAKYDDLQSTRNREMYTAFWGDTEKDKNPKKPTFIYGESGPGLLDIDPVANDTFKNFGLVYDYYKNTFGRDNFNNKSDTATVSIVHYKIHEDNAAWTGKRFVFGDGSYPMPNSNAYGMSLDIVGHEYTHAVTHHTANLVYSDQSGALNESFSDVFGCMIDREDWLIGEGIHPISVNPGMRSLADPKLHKQPDHMDQYDHTHDKDTFRDKSNDWGGVHKNSGIPNKAAFNVATELDKKGKDGKKEMEQIWYHALSLYLTYNSKFTDARDACVQSAKDLYPDKAPGIPSPEVRAVEKGFADVGIICGIDRIQTTARIEIKYPDTRSLDIEIGVGKPEVPACTVPVTEENIAAASDGIFANIDVFKCSDYLPPTNTNRWFLKVVNKGNSEGSIVDFTITDHGQTYAALDNPTEIFNATNEKDPTKKKIKATAISQIPSLRKKPPKPTGQSDTVFVMDVSGSMGDSMKGGRKIDASKSAASYYLNMIKNQDTAQGGLNRAALVEFTDNAKLDQRIGADQAALARAVAAMQPQESTNMGDGLQKALTEISSVGSSRERMIILLSDGQSNTGMSKEAIISGPVALARRECIKIYT